jgi:hypothetical protein
MSSTVLIPLAFKKMTTKKNTLVLQRKFHLKGPG